MNGLIVDAGKLRNSAVVVLKGEHVTHVAPKYTMVPKHMDNLFYFLKKEKDINPLIRSSVFHYELEFIHPFSDGNGRMGRLWQYVILMDYHPLFEVIPIESVVRERQEEYYKVLSSDIHTLPNQQDLAKLYAYFYFIKSFIPRRFVYHNSFLDLGWNINSLEEFSPGTDKYLDQICKFIIEGDIPQIW